VVAQLEALGCKNLGSRHEWENMELVDIGRLGQPVARGLVDCKEVDRNNYMSVGLVLINEQPVMLEKRRWLQSRLAVVGTEEKMVYTTLVGGRPYLLPEPIREKLAGMRGGCLPQIPNHTSSLAVDL
jgi:hypothetical protein